MKSERRHELEANELARWLTRFMERARGQFSTIAWWALAIVAVIFAISFFGSRQSESIVGAWQEYYLVATVDPNDAPSRLKKIADKYPNTPVALWARLDRSDQLCSEARRKMETDRETAILRLREAQQDYALVISNPNVLPEMIRRAAPAEAKCWELMGDREKAIESYKAVAKKYANSQPELAKDAARRASDLEEPEAADFYKWLAEYKPPATKLPNFPGMDSLFPPLGDSKEKGKEASTDSSGGAAGDEKKSDAKPDNEKQPGTTNPEKSEAGTAPADQPKEQKPGADKSEPKEKSPDGDADPAKPESEKKSPEPTQPK